MLFRFNQVLHYFPEHLVIVSLLQNNENFPSFSPRLQNALRHAFVSEGSFEFVVAEEREVVLSGLALVGLTGRTPLLLTIVRIPHQFQQFGILSDLIHNIHLVLGHSLVHGAHFFFFRWTNQSHVLHTPLLQGVLRSQNQSLH